MARLIRAAQPTYTPHQTMTFAGYKSDSKVVNALSIQKDPCELKVQEFISSDCIFVTGPITAEWCPPSVWKLVSNHSRVCRNHS